MREINKKSRIILICCLILQSSILSAEFAGGTGELNDPYQIATAEQLIAIGSNLDLLDKSFILVDDIDMDPNLPGGRIFKDALIAQDDSNDISGHSGPSFYGILDGQGHTIANLHIEGNYGYSTGLFGIFSGSVRDLSLIDVVISGSPCGAIAGFNHRGMILRCRVTGQVSGIEYVGGLAGINCDAGLVECQAHIQVIGEDDVGGMVGGGPGGTLICCDVQADVRGNQNIGGLIGNSHIDQINECRVTGMIVGKDNAGGLIGKSDKAVIWRSSANCEIMAEDTAGGLIGNANWSHFSFAWILDCYAQGSVTGSIVGGLAGETSNIRAKNCYAACEVFSLEGNDRDIFAGGLFGKVITSVFDSPPLSIACFWDAELSGIAVSTGSDPLLELGTGLTTEQIMDEDMFRNAGWDFSRVWIISEGDYPRLQWEIEDHNDTHQ